MQVSVYNFNGEVAGQVELNDDVFGVSPNEIVVHQALTRQLANRRVGTADTKTRGEVSGSGKKLYAQKHTGNARRGDRRSPLLRGGGVVFGPTPRDYSQRMPRKMRRLALKSVLSEKVRAGELKVVEKFDLVKPETKRMSGFLSAINAGSSAIVADAGVEPVLVRSARNLPGIKTMPAVLLNVADLLSYRTLILSVAAVDKINKVWGQRDKEGAGLKD